MLIWTISKSHASLRIENLGWKLQKSSIFHAFSVYPKNVMGTHVRYFGFSGLNPAWKLELQSLEKIDSKQKWTELSQDSEMALFWSFCWNSESCITLKKNLNSERHKSSDQLANIYGQMWMHYREEYRVRSPFHLPHLGACLCLLDGLKLVRCAKSSRGGMPACHH